MARTKQTFKTTRTTQNNKRKQTFIINCGVFLNLFLTSFLFLLCYSIGAVNEFHWGRLV